MTAFPDSLAEHLRQQCSIQVNPAHTQWRLPGQPPFLVLDAQANPIGAAGSIADAGAVIDHWLRAELVDRHRNASDFPVDPEAGE